jgi:hypothetical protein
LWDGALDERATVFGNNSACGQGTVSTVRQPFAFG